MQTHSHQASWRVAIYFKKEKLCLNIARMSLKTGPASRDLGARTDANRASPTVSHRKLDQNRTLKTT